MSVYATVQDVQARTSRTLDADEQAVISTLLEDAAARIDAVAPNASEAAKKIVSCSMVIRAIGDGSTSYPIGATQGSQSALGYVQSWTVSSGGTVGELYVSRADRRLLGLGNAIGVYSPTQELVPTSDSEGVTP